MRATIKFIGSDRVFFPSKEISGYTLSARQVKRALSVTEYYTAGQMRGYLNCAEGEFRIHIYPVSKKTYAVEVI